MASEQATWGSVAIPRPREPEQAPTASTPTVQRAKGLLMFRYGVPSFEAFAILLTHARMHGLDLTTAAERLIDSVELHEVGHRT